MGGTSGQVSGPSATARRVFGAGAREASLGAAGLPLLAAEAAGLPLTLAPASGVGALAAAGAFSVVRFAPAAGSGAGGGTRGNCVAAGAALFVRSPAGGLPAKPADRNNSALSNVWPARVLTFGSGAGTIGVGSAGPACSFDEAAAAIVGDVAGLSAAALLLALRLPVEPVGAAAAGAAAGALALVEVCPGEEALPVVALAPGPPAFWLFAGASGAPVVATGGTMALSVAFKPAVSPRLAPGAAGVPVRQQVPPGAFRKLRRTPPFCGRCASAGSAALAGSGAGSGPVGAADDFAAPARTPFCATDCATAGLGDPAAGGVPLGTAPQQRQVQVPPAEQPCGSPSSALVRSPRAPVQETQALETPEPEMPEPETPAFRPERRFSVRRVRRRFSRCLGCRMAVAVPGGH